MCGICGIVYSNKNKSIDKNILMKMINLLTHRGPDEEGHFINKNTGLGMRRLSIIDIKGGQQPIYNEDKTICLICNGEIYNYLELRENLEKRGHNFSTNSDTEVIVHLYEEYEQGFVRYLRGMFAIAIYDLNREKLLLVRDRLGIKPLYYAYQKGVFLFASELKAILEYPGIDKQISLKAVSDYLTYLYIPAPDTIFDGIYKLMSANMLILSNGDISLKQYWDVDYSKYKEHDEKYYIEGLNSLLKESIKMHLVSEVPLGAFLSGGMDSSAIVSLMSEITQKPVKTFSVGFDASNFNELKFAKLVAERFNTDHHEINLTPDILNILPKIVEQFDEPFADSSAIPTYLISEFAKHKVTVCLSGDGGDELFAGYGWTRRQRFIQDYNRLPYVFKNNLRKLLLGNNYYPDNKSDVFNKIRRFIHDTTLPLEDSFMRRKTCFSDGMKRDLFKNNVYEQIKGHSSISRILAYLNTNIIDNDIEKLLFLDTKIYLPGDCLCKVDRMSMMNSLEVRVPFLDHKVVEFVASMPFKYKMRGFVSKHLLKKIMSEHLPKPILRQRKLGFTIPLNSWFREKLKDFSYNILTDNPAISNLFNINYIKWILSQHAENKQDMGNQIYTLIVLEVWLRKNKYESIIG